MASFKRKTSKVKYRQDVTTMDEINKNKLASFENNKQLLPEKKRDLKNINKKLDKINIGNDIDLAEKAKILTEIKILENEINTLEQNSEYFEYISMAGDYLVNYYNITSGIYYNSCDHDEINTKLIENNNNNKNNNNKNINEDINNSEDNEYLDKEILETIDENMEQNFFTQKQTSVFDKLKQLNEISKQSRKVKKPVKKRRIIQNTTVSRSILHFLPSEENNNLEKPKIDETNEILNRATLQHKYLMLIDRGYACGKVKNNKIMYCASCKELTGKDIEKILIQAEGCYVCKECGDLEHVITESELPSHKELANEKQKYPYKKSNHLKEKLNQFQSKESTDVPEEICTIVKGDLKKRKIEYHKCTPPIIRTVLKKRQFTSWYEHLQQIYCKISGANPITLSSEVEETILGMFQAMQESFRKHCPQHRSNFLSYSYVLNKLFRILKMPEHAIFFGLLKSKEKLREQDLIWSKICKDHGWKFHSSF